MRQSDRGTGVSPGGRRPRYHIAPPGPLPSPFGALAAERLAWSSLWKPFLEFGGVGLFGFMAVAAIRFWQPTDLWGGVRIVWTVLLHGAVGFVFGIVMAGIVLAAIRAVMRVHRLLTRRSAEGRDRETR